MSYAYNFYSDAQVPARTQRGNTPMPRSVTPYSPRDTLLNLNDDQSPPAISPIAQRDMDRSFYYAFDSFSRMDSISREVYFAFMRPHLMPEISSMISHAVRALREENEQHRLMNQRLQQLLCSRIRLSGPWFLFVPESDWSHGPWTRARIRQVSGLAGRNMAAQLIMAAGGDRQHPFLLSNEIYRYCMRKFGSTVRPEDLQQ
ncbi:hypothetical protein V8E36_000821 [Tilletia maclaganii]